MPNNISNRVPGEKMLRMAIPFALPMVILNHLHHEKETAN
jgi:hypothetical protein